MRVAIRGVGVTSPAGPDLDSFARWWREGRHPKTGPSAHLAREAFAPAKTVGEVLGFRARNHIPDRKSIKLMFPRVKLGIAAAMEAWAGGVAGVGPERRAMYAACGLTVDEDWTFREAMYAAAPEGEEFDLARFGEVGQGMLNPLWLVKGLSNNVLAFVARFEEITGPNDNFMGGATGALQCLDAAASALAAGRADVALAGASDSLVTVEDSMAFAKYGALEDGVIPSQGGGFVRLERGEPGEFGVLGVATGIAPVGPDGSPWRPEGMDAALDAVAERAWAQAGMPRVAEARLVGPRVPSEGASADLWSHLGDPGAAAGGWMLAAAWMLRTEDGVRGPIELAIADPNGELAVAVLGTLS